VSVVISAGALDGSGGLDARGNMRRADAFVLPAQFLIRNRGNFDVQIDSVEQRAADFPQVALNQAARASAFACRIAKKTTRTPVQFRTDARPKFSGFG